ncbi:MAG: hypothetical protein SGI89_10645 [bacterium]|nr:hypothetical protein [bacterium]
MKGKEKGINKKKLKRNILLIKILPWGINNKINYLKLKILKLNINNEMQRAY